MATATDTYRVLRLDDDAFHPGDGQPDPNRTFARVRGELDIEAFSSYAVRAAAGSDLIRERTATGPGADGHEELYVVLDGHARFTVDGTELDAPAGTAVFVRDIEAKRSAVALDEVTTVLLVGGRRREAWRPTPGEAIEEFWPLYKAKDYEGALAVARQTLDEYPGNALALYNIACTSSLLGSTDEAVETLSAALGAHPDFVENAREDEDFV